MKNLLLHRLEQVMEEANANRRWSKLHASIRGFFSFLARRGGRRNKKAKVPGEDGDSSYTPASSIISENGELPAMSNRDKPVDTADVQELSLDENIATIDAPELSLHEIIAKTDNFSSMSCIGQGSHARVYYAVTENKRQMAVKKLDKPPKRVSRHELFTNIATASRLRHENFVELLGYHAGDDLLLLAYEFASMGSLHDILHGRKGVQGSQRGAAMPWSRRARIALDAARGLEYLHQNGIIHRNIRSSNVLLFHGFGAKIADYNLFNQAPDMATRHPSTRVLGSFAYHPPEYVMFGVMAQTSDVYSFGVVLLELLTGRKPVDVQMPSGHQSLVNWATPNLTPEKVNEIVDPRLNREYPAKGAAKLAATAAVCLQFEPDSRPEMSVVVRALQAAAKYEI